MGTVTRKKKDKDNNQLEPNGSVPQTGAQSSSTLPSSNLTSPNNMEEKQNNVPVRPLDQGDISKKSNKEQGLDKLAKNLFASEDDEPKPLGKTKKKISVDRDYTGFDLENFQCGSKFKFDSEESEGEERVVLPGSCSRKRSYEKRIVVKGLGGIFYIKNYDLWVLF